MKQNFQLFLLNPILNDEIYKNLNLKITQEISQVNSG